MARKVRATLFVERYEQARQEIPDLTPEDFFALVTPGRYKTRDSARRAMRKLRSGSTSGERIYKATMLDSGRTVTVHYRIGERVDRGTGEIVDDIRSQNVIIPVGSGRLDLLRPQRLRRAVNKGLRNSYARRRAEIEDTDEPDKTDDRYKPIPFLPPTARLARISRTVNARRPAQVIR